MITLELPIPPRTLQPNGRAHWRVKHKQSSLAKNTAYWTTREQAPRNPFADGTLCIRYTYYPPPRGKYLDDDNLIGAMKYYRDGIANALDINDKQFITYPVERGTRDGRGRVVVEIWQEGK